MSKKLTIEELTNVPVIDLGDIYLRAIEQDDYQDMYEYGKDDEVTKWLTWNTYNSIEDAFNSINNHFLTNPEKGIPLAHAIIHKEDNKMIGTCDFCFISWEDSVGEIGYCINREYWNRGYVTKACKAIIKFGFEYLGLEKIFIRHNIDNIGSKRVIEKCGFRYIKDTYEEKYKQILSSYVLEKSNYYE